MRVEPHGDWAEAILYFVVLDRFADGDTRNNKDVDRGEAGTFHGGDLVGLTRNLDELSSLGVTAIWITPVVENIPGFVTGAGFPDWGYHGYWADDFTRVDPRFGTGEELAALVEAAHERGMKVLLDVVYNHAGYGSRYTTDPATRTWIRLEERGQCGNDDLTSCVAGLPDFRTELPEVRDWLAGIHVPMAAAAGIDGFRLDTVKHIDHEFWKEHRRRTRDALGDDFFLIGEVWGGDPDVLDPWFEGDEMDAGFDFSFQGNTLAFVQGRGRPVAYNRQLERRHRTREGYHLAHYLGSHDVPTGLHQLDGDVDRFRLAAILQFTTVGIPTIYYGDEVARPGGDWPENRSDMPWGDRDVLPGRGLDRDEDLREDYRRLIEIRRAHPALWRGGHEGVADGKDHFVFARTDPATGEVVLVGINRGAKAVEATVDLPGGWSGRAVRDVWGRAPLEPADGALTIPIPPLGAAIVAAGKE